MSNNIPELPFSDDREENLRMENELLRLKLKAELGGESHSSNSLEPGIENEFLKNVLAFEHNFAKSKPVKVYDQLGKPYFKKSDELTDELLEGALTQIMDLLGDNNINVYFGNDGDYDSRTQYRFITEELFEHETYGFSMPGMSTNYDYEEFHPNHKKDIESKARDFLSQWFKRSIDEKSWELADHFVLPDRKVLTRAEVAAQIKNIFEAYTSFTDEKFVIKDVGFQLQGYEGLGHAEGGVKYTATLENGESVVIQGPFKLYMSFDNGWWSIFHIVFPGFQYS